LDNAPVFRILAEPDIDRRRHLAARFDVARGDGHVRLVLGHPLDNGAADAARPLSR
jgi:hypothetical protein